MRKIAMKVISECNNPSTKRYIDKKRLAKYKYIYFSYDERISFW